MKQYRSIAFCLVLLCMLACNLIGYAQRLVDLAAQSRLDPESGFVGDTPIVAWGKSPYVRIRAITPKGITMQGADIDRLDIVDVDCAVLDLQNCRIRELLI